MKLSLKKAEFFSFILASILGVIFHFVYEWTGNNPVIGLFFPINESTWEHLKLVYLPILLVSLIEYFLLKEKPYNFICAKFFSIIWGMIATITLFYTYSGILGKAIDFVNIIIYFIAMALAYIYSYNSIKNNKSYNFGRYCCVMALLIFLLVFILFTYMPPSLGIFVSPT